MEDHSATRVRTMPANKIAVVATGGTVCNTPDGRVSVEHVLDDIDRWYSDSADPARPEVREVFRRGAQSLTPGDWLTVARAVADAVGDPDTRGVVVTHGTFTAEETAYFLHLVVPTPKPVVLACSQRKHGTVGNDGDRNLLDALRVAGEPAAAGKGVLVVLNEEILSAREVTKTSRRPSGFRPDHSGILGTVDDDRVVFYRAPTRRHTHLSEFSIPDQPLPRVDVVATYPGADGVAVEAFVRAGARGIVVNGFSFDGRPAAGQWPALEDAASKGVQVVLVNRGHGGRVAVADGDPFIGGDNLTAQKARILLMVALAETEERTEIRRIFSEY